MTDENLKGKIYYMGAFPNQFPRLMKILNVYYDPAYYSTVYQGITNEGRFELDKAVMLRYCREATSEEILLYWKE